MDRADLVLTRYRYGANCTQGIIVNNGTWIADSLELPWLDNHHDISCIPEGVYQLEYEGHHEKLWYDVLNVPDRTGIMLHQANYVIQLKGCIAVGIKCVESVEHSALTLRAMIELVGRRPLLEIRKI